MIFERRCPVHGACGGCAAVHPSNRRLAQLFKQARSMSWLAKRYGLPKAEVEAAIRRVANRGGTR